MIPHVTRARKARTLCTFTANQNHPPATGFATLDSRNSHPVLDFDASSIESAIFAGVLPIEFNGLGLTVDLVWAATTATTNSVVWGISFENDQSQDIDADFFDAEKTVTSATSGTSGRFTYSTITFVSDEMGGLVAGNMFRLKVRRLATNGSDNMAGDAELKLVHVYETYPGG